MPNNKFFFKSGSNEPKFVSIGSKCDGRARSDLDRVRPSRMAKDRSNRVRFVFVLVSGRQRNSFYQTDSRVTKQSEFLETGVMRKPKNPRGKRSWNIREKNETRLSATCANSWATRNNVFLKVSFFHINIYI